MAMRCIGVSPAFVGRPCAEPDDQSLGIAGVHREGAHRCPATVVPAPLPRGCRTYPPSLTAAAPRRTFRATVGDKHYVLLARHGARAINPLAPEEEHALRQPPETPTKAGDPAAAGVERTRVIAGALAGALEAEGVEVAQILHSPHVVARETAAVYRSVLTTRRCGAAELLECSQLDPRAREGDFRDVLALAKQARQPDQ